MRSSLTRVEKVRIYPNPSQIRAFERILWTCCTLYNGSLQERRDAYKRYKLAGKPKDFVWPNFKHQTSILTLARKENIWLKTVYSETLADVLKKIDVAMSAFMKRVSICFFCSLTAVPRNRGSEGLLAKDILRFLLATFTQLWF